MKLFFLKCQQKLSYLAVIFLLAACGASQQLSVVSPNDEQLHEVKINQSVNLIADLYFISPEEIIEANALSAPYNVSRGQRLIIPQAFRHTVIKGDSIAGIAQKYQVHQNDVLKMNGMQANDKIVAGQRIKIPSKSYTNIRVTQTTPPKQKQGVSNVKRIAVPKPPPIPTQKSQQKLNKVALVKAPAARKKTSVQKKVAPKISKVVKKEKKVDFKIVSNAPKIIWPIRGKVISGFGSKNGGTKNDGINILTSLGSPVKAVADGSVVYAGDKLSGFGNILIIRHQGNLMSAYAHNQKLLVTVNETVKQGQIVARSGQSGSVASPQLHFEIREGTKPVDPKKYLPK